MISWLIGLYVIIILMSVAKAFYEVDVECEEFKDTRRYIVGGVLSPILIPIYFLRYIKNDLISDIKSLL